MRWIIIGVILLTSCQKPQPPSTVEMANLLEELAQLAYSSPQYPYANELRAKESEKSVALLPYKVPFFQRLNYLNELLSAGNTEKCIAETEKVISAAFPDKKITPKSKPYFELLALAYLRLGEQNNCLNHHTSQSCIIPIKVGGIHQDKLGSEKASSIYEKLMIQDSTDLQSRWLYNIAQMTLGNYPDKIPSQWVIPEIAFKSEYEIPTFPDIAHHKSLAVVGHAGGCSMEDFNNDGRLDIFMTSYLPEDQCRLFFQEEGGEFSDVTESAGLLGITGGLNNIHADYNNDGNIDIFITRGGWLQNFGKIPNSLLKNNGDGTFTDVTKSAGLFSMFPTQTAAWADINLDGNLDLFVGNESTHMNGHASELFINNGDGTFSEVAKKLGLEINAFIKGVFWGDLNNDLLPDLYISILGQENLLFMNRGGENIDNWKFEEIGKKAGVNSPINSFPGWIWDFDNDGYKDILVSGYYGKDINAVTKDVASDYLNLNSHSSQPALFRNNGDETFTNLSDSIGLDKTLFTMGGNFGDIDNDGWLDAYFGTGEFNFRAIIPNKMFRNDKGKKFQDVTTAGGFGQIQKGHGISFGDIDNDGDQDIYTVIGGALQGDIYNNMLFENPGNSNNWVTLRLQGSTANRSAIGSRVKLIIEQPDGDLNEIYRTVSTGGSFGANSLQLEIGLGKAVKIREIEVRWPNKEKTYQKWENVEINQIHDLQEKGSL